MKWYAELCTVMVTLLAVKYHSSLSLYLNLYKIYKYCNNNPVTLITLIHVIQRNNLYKQKTNIIQVYKTFLHISKQIKLHTNPQKLCAEQTHLSGNHIYDYTLMYKYLCITINIICLNCFSIRPNFLLYICPFPSTNI